MSQLAIDYAATLSERTKRFCLAAVFIALFLTSLDQTVVVAALPQILADLKNLDLLAWTSASYLLVSTSSLPLFGKLSDLYGRRAILFIGIAIFLIGSMLCGLAPTMLLLVIFRGVQGLGCGALSSVVLTIPADLYAPAERARLQGTIAIVFALSSIVGPLLGGVLTDLASWHWIFFINLPFGLVALYITAAFMPRLDSGQRIASIDYAGAALLSIGVVALLVACSLDRTQYPWSSALVIGLLGMAVVGLGLFVFVEARVKEPLLPLRLFAIPSFTLLCAASACLGGTFIVAILFLPIYLVNVLGASATEAGLALVPETLGIMVSASIGGNLVQRTGRYKTFLLCGLVGVGVGFFMLTFLQTNTAIWYVWLSMGVLGLGAGAAFPQANLALQNAVPFRDVGVATSARLFFNQLSQTICSALFGALLTLFLTTALTNNLRPIAAQVPPDLAVQLDAGKLRNGSTEAAKALDAFTVQAKVRLGTTTARRLHGEAEAALKRSFALSITQLYFWGLPLTVVAVLLGLLLPELPLKRSNLEDSTSP